MDFGELHIDPTYHIYRSDFYFAVDVGVQNNTGSWNIVHEVSSINNIDGEGDLNNNINVTFVSQHSDNTSTVLKKRAYANADETLSEGQIGDGNWLRIYYGLATGQNDANGVEPITTDKPSGHYEGSVKISLTVNG